MLYLPTLLVKLEGMRFGTSWECQKILNTTQLLYWRSAKILVVNSSYIADSWATGFVPPNIISSTALSLTKSISQVKEIIVHACMQIFKGFTLCILKYQFFQKCQLSSCLITKCFERDWYLSVSVTLCKTQKFSSLSRGKTQLCQQGVPAGRHNMFLDENEN